MEFKQKKYLEEQAKKILHEVVDNNSFNNVCFTYRISNNLAGQHYKIALNKKLPKELQEVLYLNEIGHIVCGHLSKTTTLDSFYTIPKIKAIYSRLKPLFDGQDFDEMYDIFEDYIFGMIRNWEVHTKFFTKEEIEEWDSLYPEECGLVHHMLPEEVGYPSGLTANEYLTLILEDPETWFQNMQINEEMRQNKKRNMNGTEGGCNTNQQTPPSSNDDYNENDRNHNKEDKKKKDKQQNNQQNNQQGQQGQQNDQQGQQNDQNNQQGQQGQQDDQQGQQDGDQNGSGSSSEQGEEQDNWQDEKESGSGSSSEQGEEQNGDQNDSDQNGSGGSSDDEQQGEEEQERTGSATEEKQQLTKEEMQQLVESFVKKMLDEQTKRQELIKELAKRKTEESSGYSRSSDTSDYSGCKSLEGDISSWDNYGNLEEEIKELLVNKAETVTKRDLLYHYNRGKFSDDVCVPKYRTETTYEETPMTVLLDVSGSISETNVLGFVDIFKNISKDMDKRCSIVFWSDRLMGVYDSQDEIKPAIGGGTNIGEGIEYIVENFQGQEIGSLFVVSDCEDNLTDWLNIYDGTKYLVCWTSLDTIQRFSGSLFEDFKNEFGKILVREK